MCAQTTSNNNNDDNAAAAPNDDDDGRKERKGNGGAKTLLINLTHDLTLTSINSHNPFALKKHFNTFNFYSTHSLILI